MQWKTYEVFTDPGDFFSFICYLIQILNLTETITNNDKSHFPHQTFSLEKEKPNRRKNAQKVIQNFFETSNLKLEKIKSKNKPKYLPRFECWLSFGVVSSRTAL